MSHRRYLAASSDTSCITAVLTRENVPKLLEAFRLAREQYPDLTLVMMGRGYQSWPRCTRLSGSRTADLDRLRQRSSQGRRHTPRTALVYVSLYEGFGLPLMEAFAVGTPVVTANSSLRELAGEAAHNVDPMDPEDIARGMLRSGIRDYKYACEAGLRRCARHDAEARARGSLLLLPAAAARGGPTETTARVPGAVRLAVHPPKACRYAARLAADVASSWADS